MSCSACFHFVNPARRYPTRNVKLEISFAPFRAAARPNVKGRPLMSATYSLMTRFPNVARHAEASKTV